jgi:putative FmdB family regulatory protein
MPLYEYQCFLCHRRFERIQRAGDELISKCPGCGGETRRLLGVPALQFKGSGWYVTDYGKGNGGRSTTPERSMDAGKTKSPKKQKDKESPTQSES